MSRHQFQQNLNYHNKINFYLNKQELLGIYIKIGVGGTNPKQAVYANQSHGISLQNWDKNFPIYFSHMSDMWEKQKHLGFWPEVFFLLD